jgi:hypothetical protein
MAAVIATFLTLASQQFNNDALTAKKHHYQ